MFSMGAVARVLRRLGQATDAPRERNESTELDVILAALCEWGASLPWVEGMPCPETAGLKVRFRIECEPLRCREPWFAILTASDDLVNEAEVMVVLPEHIAHRGVSVGWAAGAFGIGDERAIANLPLPTTADQLRALEQLLETAYSAAFHHAAQRG
jgi:hypothetical protein